ncbi:histidine N-acetyltransferase [Branchiostoma belcheri]|nr:histidine N-acetyltransferase [Branchiostoma belcheri]
MDGTKGETVLGSAPVFVTGTRQKPVTDPAIGEAFTPLSPPRYRELQHASNEIKHQDGPGTQIEKKYPHHPQVSSNRSHHSEITMPRDCLTFRLATHDDFAGVVAMSEGVYGGLDYLPSHYHAFIDDPQRLVVLAELDCQIVGLSSAFIVDGGEVYIEKALRVAESCRGLGISRRLTEHVDRLVRSHFPTVERKRKLVADAGKIESLKKKGMEVVCRLPTTTFVDEPNSRGSQGACAIRATNNIFGTIENNLPTLPEVRRLHADDLPSVLRPEVSRKLLTNGLMSGRWDALNFCEENFLYLLNNGFSLFADHTEPFVESFSFGKCFQVPSGLQYFVDLHASEERHVKAHLLKHFAEMCRCDTELPIYLTVSVAEEAMVEAVETFCSEVLCLRPFDLCHDSLGVVVEGKL